MKLLNDDDDYYFELENAIVAALKAGGYGVDEEGNRERKEK